ncbi:MAG: serpin family protein [Candidatus Nanoarchaeia archaeon]|nr:serpin family protein [Candidatus Nanoarchaeia archaeon]
MLVILQKEDLESIDINNEKLNELKGMLHKTQVDVYMPKFKFETKYFMADDLKQMGMPTAFDIKAADFSGMTGIADLYISKVIHQAFVEVNEEGTEAAAATGVVMTFKSAIRSDIFRADHPFIFIIQQKNTGNILFMGRVTDPTSSN